MNARALAAVALILLGLDSVVQGVVSLVQLGLDGGSSFVPTFVASIAVGSALALAAPWLARKLLPGSDEPWTEADRIHAADLQTVGFGLLGVWLVVGDAWDLVHVLLPFAFPQPAADQSTFDQAVPVLVELAVAVVLILKSRALASLWWSRQSAAEARERTS